MGTFLSNFYGKEIFNDKGLILGKIESFTFDVSKKRILGFIIKDNDNKKFLKINEINFLNNIFFTVKNIENNTYIYGYEILGKKVLGKSLFFIGSVIDIEIDFNYKIKSIIVESGFNFYTINKIKTKIQKSQILSYNKYFILIEDKNFIVDKQTLKNIYTFFLGIKNNNYNIKN